MTVSIDPSDTKKLLKTLHEATRHLKAMAKEVEYPFDLFNKQDSWSIHKMYVRNLVACYVSTYNDLSYGILKAVRDENYLVYALCGRSLLELTATLRYYIFKEYTPFFANAAGQDEFTQEDIKKLLDIDDRHLRGSRFDWESFIFANYQKLREDAQTKLKAKKNKTQPPQTADDVPPIQVNVLTCIENWAATEPGVLFAYDLFCDLVHPNVGSSFLVASTSEDGFYFSRFRGDPIGRTIFEQSFPILLSLTHKRAAELLTQLMLTTLPEVESPPQ